MPSADVTTLLRYNGSDGACYPPRLDCYSCRSAPSIRVAVPGFIEVYSVGSVPATKYRGAPDREPSPSGAWALVHPPKNGARTSKSRTCPQCARPEPGQSSIWAPRPCTLPVRGAEPQTVLHDIHRRPSLETLPICVAATSYTFFTYMLLL